MGLTALCSSVPTEVNRPTSIVKRDRHLAKFWLAPITLVKNRGFPEHELTHITHLVVKHQPTLLEAWHDYFSS